MNSQYLVGSEDVARGERAVQSGAGDMLRAAANFGHVVFRLEQGLKQHRIEMSVLLASFVEAAEKLTGGDDA